MKKFIVKYIDKSDDLSSVWVSASSKEEAKSKAKQEYWDIKEIIMCTEQ
jgi:type II secretory pathway component PulF